jgi:hypothetical protein
VIISDYVHNSDGTYGLMGDFWTITAASEQVGYEAANLLTNDLNQKWVSWGQRAAHNWLEMASDVRNSERYVDIVAMLGIDRQRPTHVLSGTLTTNIYRIIVDQFPIATRRRPPVETVSMTNLTGTAATINGPVYPPDLVPVGYTTTKMTATSNAVNTVLIADFENNRASERELGSGPHYIRVHYVHSVLTSAVPSLSVSLRYNGVTVGSPRTVQTRESTSEGFVFLYEFADTDLPGTTGTIGIRVEGTTNGTSTPVPIGVELLLELDGWLWDSHSDANVTDSTILYPRIVELPGTTIDPAYQRYVYWEMSDFVQKTVGLGTVSPGGSSVPVISNLPVGGFESAAFFAGRLIAAESTMEFDVLTPGGRNITRGGDVSSSRTRGGYPRSSRNPLIWEDVEINLPKMARSDYYSIADSFFRRVGFSRPFLILFDPLNPSRDSGWYKLTSWTAPDAGWWTGDGKSDLRFDLSFTVTEATATQIR